MARLQIQYSQSGDSCYDIHKTELLHEKLQERTSRVSAQFRAGYPISSDRVSPRKRVFTERFHVHA